jgi:SAM-dependent methyltransferase
MLRNLLKSALTRRPTAAAGEPPPLRLAEPFVAFVTMVSSVRRWDTGSAGFHDLASTRLRVLIPARELAASLPVVFVPIDYLRSDPGLERIGRPRAIVLGKLATTFVSRQRDTIEALLSSLAETARRVPLVADLSDDYSAMGQLVGEPFFDAYQRALGRLCTLTVPCQALADRLGGVAEKGVRVIEDPWESPRANAPRTPARAPLRLCWFGVLGEINVALVEAGLLQVAERIRTPVALDIVTGAEGRGLVERVAMRLRERNPDFAARFVPWSLEATWGAIDECDVVVLPQDSGGEWGSVKSHNRLVEAIRGGRFAVASPIRSYGELAAYAWVGDDLGEGVAWALANPEEARARIAAGQAYIATRFAPEVVGRKWADLLATLAPAPPAPARGPDAAAAPVRLNLGCGDKILPGYVNVDVAPSRAGRAPDLQCDLRHLSPIATDSCDEVLSVHVVEHFWRWEVVEVLREWLRVLKPGGAMVLECPNLLAACEAFLKDPAGGARTGAEAQRTMWVLYGDPQWRDPLMCHRWGYTPASLREVMEEAGLVNVRQEPAQFKLREPRDMRLVGEKPAAPRGG